MNRQEYQKQYYERNKERLKEAERARRAAIPLEERKKAEAERYHKRKSTEQYKKTHREAARRRYHQNPEKHRNRSRDYHEEHRETIIAKMRKRSRLRYESGEYRLKRYKDGAEKRGLDWRLDDEEAKKMFQEECAYCKSPPDPINGIDRIDNDLGYVFGNVTTCCGWCNWAKKTGNANDFRAYLLRVATNLHHAICDTSLSATEKK